MYYKCNLANYPTSFKGYIISPTKICLQFNDVEIKTRINGNEDALLKYGPNNEKHVLISTLGTRLDGIAIGCQMPIVEVYQIELIKAYKDYYMSYKNHYHKNYQKQFKDFIFTIKKELDNLFEFIEQKEKENV
jgi:hypothetical protein